MERLRNFESVSIKWAGYEASEKILYVAFAGSEKVYAYAKVPASKWTALQKAESKGQYINRQIKPFHEVTVKG